ncbi:MAG: FAD-dependent monooxygenase, partial [Comamonadaceae bacterium]|nr:FAD-dependent monooxygenase [Comamonadaceae bacterium]
MSKQLLIAGGGIGGMAAALATARAGWQVQVLERASALAEVGAGIQLGPNVTRVLHAWGLGQALAAVAAFPERLSVRDALSGAELGALPLGARMQARYGAPYVTIHRADLLNLLHAAAVAQPGVQIHLGQTLARHEPAEAAQASGAGAMPGVAVHTESGQTLQAAALVGADGVWSRVRAQLLHDGPPRVSGHLAWRTLLRQAALPAALRSQHVTAWLGPRLHAVQYPVRQGDWLNLVVITEGAPPADLAGWDHHANTAELARHLAPLCAPLRDLAAAAPQARVNEHAWRLWPLCDRPPLSGPGQQAQGRVALLGDAAHPMRPYLAQGAGMAIEDAAELGRCLAGAGPADDVPARLHAYANARWARCARVQARAIRNGQLFHATGPVRLGRDAAMRALGARVLDVPWLY